MCLSVVSKISFLPVFFPLFYGEVMKPMNKNGHIRHQRLKINTNRCFVFRFTQLSILTVIFAILVGHIDLKILTENAGLQFHTMPIAEEHNMSIWIKLLKIWSRESAAKEIPKKVVMTSLNKKIKKNEKSILLNFSCEYLCKISSKLAERFGYKLLWNTHTHIQTYRHTSSSVLTY